MAYITRNRVMQKKKHKGGKRAELKVKSNTETDGWTEGRADRPTEMH